MKEKVIVPEKTTTIISEKEIIAPPADRGNNTPPVINEKVIVPEKTTTINSEPEITVTEKLTSRRS